MVKKFILLILPLIDILVAPFIFPALFLLKYIRKAGVSRFPLCRGLFIRVGVFPIDNHYFEPKFDYRDLTSDWQAPRSLPAIDLNEQRQLALFEKLTYAEELAQFPENKPEGHQYYYNNNSYLAGDADFLYQIIRHLKPQKMIEIGSGNSTLIASSALKKNQNENANDACEHVCIEPFEMPWLEAAGIKTVRKMVEDIELEYFDQLDVNDILFIDSSHIIRPGGDVLHEYMQILPRLKPGVIVHIHDIFTPRDYLRDWLKEDVRFWNEQYLVEAFLSNNRDWTIIAALNYIKNEHFDTFQKISPRLQPDHQPGALYIQKVQ